VFVFGDRDARGAALATNCASRILVPPDPWEVHRQLYQLYRAEAMGLRLEPEDQLVPGQRVRVTSGPFFGFEGVIIRRITQYRLILTVDFLQRGASLEIYDFELERI